MKSNANVIESLACNITCFQREKVAHIKSELTKEKQRLLQVAELHKLLGNATRLKILMALAQGELCVCDVAHVLELTAAATSHQLKLLLDQGWLIMRNDGKMVYYRLHGEGLLKALKDDFCLLKERLT